VSDIRWVDMMDEGKSGAWQAAMWGTKGYWTDGTRKVYVMSVGESAYRGPYGFAADYARHYRDGDVTFDTIEAAKAAAREAMA
jgi:hypothetical protein